MPLSNRQAPSRILSIFGTRPEAIKMAPLLQTMAGHDAFVSKVCVTAQHRQMLDEVLRLFDIVPDYDLDVMDDDQSPTQVAATVMSRLEPVLRTEKPDWVLVQGDTTTTVAAALAGFYAGARVGHVEAGLRTGDKWQPFPEEINRRIVTLVTDLHFAPTEQSRQNLLNEGVPDSRILVTGNTVIDALHWVLQRPAPSEIVALLEKIGLKVGGPRSNGDPKLILVTAHRRENFGAPLANICEALRTIAMRFDDQVQVVYPVHLNPNILVPVRRMLGGLPNVTLTEPLDYLAMAHLANNSYLIVTDSGGLQEEAPSLGKPVLIVRKATERTETVAVGAARMVGVETETIVAEINRLLDDEAAYQAMTSFQNPYGDGRAGERIIAALQTFGSASDSAKTN
jgi:UDP-N-acetylglucosamine 2-epimerase (non-hydrolysing)